MPVLKRRFISPPLFGLLLFSLFALFEVYRPALGGPFVFDDIYLPFLRPGDDTQPLRVWLSGVRPVLMFTYWLNIQAWGLDPYWFHVVNVLLHAAAGLLVWFIARKLLGEAWLATLCTFVFLFHPLQTESVSYVAGRSELVSALFFLGAFTIFLYRRSAALGWSESVAILVLYGLAVMTKEHTISLLPVLLLTDFYFNPGFKLSGIFQNWRLYVAATVGAILPAAHLLRTLRTSQSAGFQLKGLSAWDYLLTQFRAIWGYVTMFFLPRGQNIDHDFPISHSLTEHGAGLALLLWIIAGVLAWRMRKRLPVASYSFFLFLILLAPTSSVLPIRDVFVERRMYLPIVAMGLLCASLLGRWKARMPVKWALAGGAVLLLMAATLNRNEVWSSALTLWSDSAAKAPGKSRPHAQLAYALYQQRQCAASAAEYRRASSISQGDAFLAINWAAAAECAGAYPEALQQLAEARRLQPSARVSAMIGLFQTRRQNFNEAMLAFAEAERLDPQHRLTYLYRGDLHMLRRDFDAAVAQFQLAMLPEDQRVRHNTRVEAAARKRLASALRAKKDAASSFARNGPSAPAGPSVPSDAGSGMFLALP